MLVAIFAFFIGICILQFFTFLPSLWQFTAVFLPVFIFCTFFSYKVIPDKWRFIPKALCFMMLGFLWVFCYAKCLSSWSLPQNLEGNRIAITGYVASLPEINDKDITFTFNTETIAGVVQHTKLRLSWYDETVIPHFNDKWQLCVKLKRPHSMLNLGGFDFEQYLWSRGIRASGYVFKCQNNHLLAAGENSGFISNLRQKLKEAMANSLLGRPLAGMIIALVLGDQSGISKEQWQIFRDTGTSYLMAIAGLHISLFAGLMFLAAQFIWRRITCLVLRIPAQQAAAVMALIGGVVYSVISGFSIPTQRALVMLIAFMLAILLRRNIKPLKTLFLALLIVLLLDPLAVLSVGFWLSFVAVIFIFYVSGARLCFNYGWFRKYWKMQWAITLGLMPLTLLFFQQMSFSTLLANIIALPGVCSVVVPLSLLGGLLLLGFPKLGTVILWLAEKLMEMIWIWLQWLASFPQFNWYHAIFHWWILAAAFIGILLLLAPRGFPARITGVVWLLPLIFYLPAGPKHQEVWFDLLDVGQGLAAVVRTQNHTLIYDAGPKFGEMDAGEAILVPFLRASGVGSVDTMVISHGDDDHFGGAFSVVKTLPVKNIITSVPEKFAGVIAAQHCYAGQFWQWDGIKFTFLHPEQKTEHKILDNQASCVLRIDDGKNSILLTGDIEKAAEKEMIKSESKNLRATILVVPHHGSATAALPEFVESISPQYALFPVGYLNRFNFPADSVVNLYRDLGAKILTTADSGQITFEFDANNQQDLKPQLYRILHKSYWME